MKKQIVTLLTLLALCGWTLAAEAPPPVVENVTVSGLALEGEIQGENIVFNLAFSAEAEKKGVVMPLVIGDVAFMDGSLPRNVELSREGNRYTLRFASTRRQDVTCRFASKPVKDGEWRHTTFSIPAATVRKLSIICDREDLDIQFPGALDVKTQKAKDGRKQVTAFLGVSGQFEVRWKPLIRKLDSELAMTCEAQSVATAGVGALHGNTVYTYRIIQGALAKLALQVPAEVNITQVYGEDIQDWHVEKASNAVPPRLVVTLSRPKEDVYRLRVESELALSKFPARFSLPALVPERVLRTSGFLLLGTDSAIKLQVVKAGGLTQMDLASFPAPANEKNPQEKLPLPLRSTFAYQFANMPYALDVNADDIVPTFSAEEQLALTLTDNELVFEASVQLDIKDAPARELLIEADPDPQWTVTAITGQHVAEADTDVREEKGRRVISVPFKQAVSGTILVNVRMEKTLKADAVAFSAPTFRVPDAKAERGSLVVATEKGIRLKTEKMEGLRETHAASAGQRVEGAQQTYRFKDAAWSISLGIERAAHAIHSEAFHLISLGGGVMYCSDLLTYHVAGAPIQEFKLSVPKAIEHVEFTGADIEGWTRDGDVCTIRLQRKIMGDYTLLASYDRQFPEQGGDITLGDIETIGTESELGYIVVATSASLKKPELKQKPESFIADFDPTELPPEYAKSVSDPILAAYKYVRTPHRAVARIEPYATEKLLDQIADYVRLVTEISRDGECVTTASYSIKNSSRQYLTVSLPEGSKLWWVRCLDETGQSPDVHPQHSEKGLLVPLRRLRDPNAPMYVEIRYAQSLRKLGFWRTGLAGFRVQAPHLGETQAAFSSWEVKVPEGFSIAQAGGNMTADSGADYSGVRGVLIKTARFLRALAGGPWDRYRVRPALAGGINGGRSLELTEPVKLSADGPLVLDLQVVPGWMGSNSSARRFAGYLLVGVGMLVWGMKRKSTALTALALTVAILGLSYSAAGRSALAVLVGLAVLGLLIRFVWVSIRYLVAQQRARRAAELARSVTPEDDDDPLPLKPTSKGGTGASSVLFIPVLVFALTLSWADSALAAKPPVMQSVQVTVDAPGTGRDVEKSAGITAVLTFKATEPGSVRLLPAACVLTSYTLADSDLELKSEPGGYVLTIKDDGEYAITLNYRTPVEYRNGQSVLTVPLPGNLKNQVKARFPETGLDVQAEAAVLFKSEEKKGITEVEAVFGPVANAVLTWRPTLRKTKLEETVFYAESSAFVSLQPGVVELNNVFKFQVAQGEIKELRLRVPAGMTVTAVRAPGLATWSFDPDKRTLDAILDRATSEDLTLHVSAQIAREGLPYSADVGAFEVEGASRQRGVIALAAPDSIQVHAGEAKGLNPMNIEDFPAEAVVAATTEVARRNPLSIRKAYRYSAPAEVAVAVSTERVLPEVRVAESGALSISDERVVMANKLVLSLGKAGIFAVELLLPPDYDIETLTGKDVSHWDDIKEGARGVVVHFSRQVTDVTEVNLVMAKSGKGVEPKLTAPRVVVRDAAKHTGKLTVSGERGIRIMVDSHTGVDLRKSSEEGIQQSGVLVFDILRPDWSLMLKTEVMAPVVKPEVLQVVDLAEGMLQCKAFIEFRIENAGVKTFRLQSPAPGLTLSVAGKGIARVAEVDKEKGIWQVDLHGKVEDSYAMVATYQVPYNPAARKVTITALRTLDTQEQRGYLAITGAGRVEVKAEGTPVGLKEENPRTIPPSFNAGDLSGAVQCFRMLRPDFRLELSVVRHDSASVLPARVERVSIISTLSAEEKLLSQVTLGLRVSSLRMLKVSLPTPKDTLWTVRVNGKAVPVSRDGAKYCIPLDEAADQAATVELLYTGMESSGGLGFRRAYEAPTFDGLPLNNIEWKFYGLPDRKYSWFGGTMEYVDGQSGGVQVFDTQVYGQGNINKRNATLQLARQDLDKGRALVKAGQIDVAKKAFREALNYSQGQDDLNEDARIQYRALQQQQLKIGLVNRRDAVRVRNNIMDGPAADVSQGFQGGNYSQEYAGRVEQRLSENDNGALDAMAQKAIEQQAAAAGVVSAIHVTMPEHGRLLVFRRAVQIDPNGVLSVKFRAGSGALLGALARLWPAAVLFLGLWIWLAHRRDKAGVA